MVLKRIPMSDTIEFRVKLKKFLTMICPNISKMRLILKKLRRRRKTSKGCILQKMWRTIRWVDEKGEL